MKMDFMIIHLMVWQSLLDYTDVINMRRLSTAEEDYILFTVCPNTGRDDWD